MSRAVTIWGGDEWQEHFILLAKAHYGPGNFVCVPDKDRGDYGLEGFSRDGKLYQCYAAEEPCTADELYEKQRNKITKDLGKFIKYQAELKEILGEVRISHWILAVPHFDTKRLLSHAETKAAEIRALNLSCATHDFCVCLEDGSCFAVEQQRLLHAGVGQIHIRSAPVASTAVSGWVGANEALVAVMDEKLKKLPSLREEQRRESFRARMIKKYLEGQNILTQLHDDYPELYQEISMCKAHHEDILAFECDLAMGPANQTLNAAVTKYKEELNNKVRGIQTYTIEDLAMEAVSDWLLRCPLHFPDAAA